MQKSVIKYITVSAPSGHRDFEAQIFLPLAYKKYCNKEL